MAARPGRVLSELSIAAPYPRSDCLSDVGRSTRLLPAGLGAARRGDGGVRALASSARIAHPCPRRGDAWPVGGRCARRRRAVLHPARAAPGRPGRLIADWGTLGRRCWSRSRSRGGAGGRGRGRRPAGGAVLAVALDRAVALSLRHHPAGDADRGDRAPDHRVGQQRRSVAADLRLDRGVLPHPVQHDPWPQLGRSQSAQPVRALRGGALAHADPSPPALGAALFPGRPAHLGRPGADRRRRRGVRGRHRRRRLGPGLSHPRIGLPAQDPAHVRGPRADLGDRHRDLPAADPAQPPAAAALARERAGAGSSESTLTSGARLFPTA